MTEKKVMAFGCFNILHLGHLTYLEKAKSFGGKLIVVVARDSTIKKEKEKEPFFDEKARCRMVSALRMVDETILGDEHDRYAVIRKMRPDVLVLGYDQPVSINELKEKLVEMGLEKTKIVKVEQYKDDEIYKSSKVLEKLRKCVLNEI